MSATAEAGDETTDEYQQKRATEGKANTKAKEENHWRQDVRKIGRDDAEGGQQDQEGQRGASGT